MWMAYVASQEHFKNFIATLNLGTECHTLHLDKGINLKFEQKRGFINLYASILLSRLTKKLNLEFSHEKKI